MFNPLRVWKDARAKMPLRLMGYVADGVAPAADFVDGTYTVTFTNKKTADRFLTGQWEDKPVPDVIAKYLADEAGVEVVVVANPFCLDGTHLTDAKPSEKAVPEHPRDPEEDDDNPFAPKDDPDQDTDKPKGFLSKITSIFKK
jgi:hypothetical protein